MIVLFFFNFCNQNNFLRILFLLFWIFLFLIVYDITDERSFEELNYWIKEVKEINKNEELIIGIAANKCDLYEYQEVSFGEGVKFAKDNNCLFYITSAKDHDSIENAFEGLTIAYIEQIEGKKKYFK